MFQDFIRDRSGHFAVTMALASLPLFAAAGIAVDYSQATRTRAEFQNAADSAALAAAQDPDMSTAERKEIAQRYFDTNAAGFTLTSFNVVESNGSVTVDAKARIKTSLMQVIGQPYMDVAVTATAEQKASKLEIVFALDVSGSMLAGMSNGQSRINALKAATTALIDKLAAQTDYDIKIGYVPFTMNVNIGTANSSLVQGDADPLFAGTDWKGCVFERAAPNHVKDSPAGKWHAMVWPPMPNVTGAGDSANNPSNGTNTGYAVLQEASQPTGDPSVLLGGPNYNCTRNVLMPLSSDLESVKSGINSLQSAGNQGTLIAPGVTWGMRLLSPAAPFTEGAAYSGSVKKILFVVTDGEQVTEAEFYGDGVYNGSQNATTPWVWDPAKYGLGGSKLDSGFGPMDHLSPYGFIRDSRPFGGMASDWEQHKDQLVELSDAACNEVKANGGGRDITVYSMGVSDATGPGTRAYTALRNCASSTKNHFYVQDSAAMDAAFAEILERFKNLQLTH